jgi:pimeloyl-ACP methyl ester carboxylesterase
MTQTSYHPQPLVILLHGIARTKRSMAKLERHLQSHGFATLNLDYPSTRLNLEQIVDHLHPLITTHTNSHPGPIHFIGYFMGGLVIRAYLAKYRPANLGHVVMLGTPNAGSEIADFLKNVWLYKKFYGPAGQQLITKQDDFAHLFAAIDYPLGILAGSRSLDPLSSLIIRQPNDGKVSIASTKLDGMADHRIIPATHTFFPSHKSAQDEIVHFLRHGKFTSPKPDSSL